MLSFPACRACFHFALEFRGIGNHAVRENQRNDADRNIDEENPAPGKAVGDPSAQRRADGRRGDDRHAVERESRGALVGGKRIDQDRLLHRSQSPAANALQHAKENQPAETWREPAEQRGDGEQRDATHVVILAAEDAAEPRAERQNDRVGHQIAGQHPSAFVAADGEAAGDVRQRHVGDGGVEQLHERGEGHGQRDEPRVDAGGHALRSDSAESCRLGCQKPRTRLGSRINKRPTGLIYKHMIP